MGAEIAALAAYFGLTGFFATIGAVFAAWMAWRIVEKAGVPGWVGLGAVLLTLTGIGSIVPLILLWVFAFMRWPRDQRASTTATLSPPVPAPSLPPPAASERPAPLGDRRLWQLSGSLADGRAVVLAIEPASGGYFLTGAPSTAPNVLSVPDASVGQPHARLLTAGNRLGIEDLGTPGGTSVDGARLTSEHGPRDISQARMVRLGRVDLALSRN